MLSSLQPISYLIQFIATAEHKSDDTNYSDIKSEQRERVDHSEMGETATHGEELLNVYKRSGISQP